MKEWANREMKCRAWHKGEGKFLKVKRLDVCEGSIVRVHFVREFEQEARPPISVDDKNLVLVWYTGLKDGNGVEIFEGDIIQTEIGTLQVVEYINEIVKGTFCSAGFFAWDEGKNTWMTIETSDRVIGNRFENPELLEVLV